MSKRPTRWIHLSDLQLGHLSSRVKDNDARAHRLIEPVVAEEPDFINNAGDHIDGAVNADPAGRQRVTQLWADYHDVMWPLTAVCPVVSALGNLSVRVWATLRCRLP